MKYVKTQPVAVATSVSRDRWAVFRPVDWDPPKSGHPSPRAVAGRRERRETSTFPSSSTGRRVVSRPYPTRLFDDSMTSSVLQAYRGRGLSRAIVQYNSLLQAQLRASLSNQPL